MAYRELGGDEGDRTPDLGIANAALSQLSYIPLRSSMIEIMPLTVKEFGACVCIMNYPIQAYF